MHIPLRMCVACRQMRPQNELIRVVRDNKTGEIRLDTEKKLMGRGAYLCKSAECMTKAKKKNVLARHFSCAVPEEIYTHAEKLIDE